jgi:predicted nucleotidyltransferase
MNRLSEILSSRTRAEIFRLLFGIYEGELHVRELQRRSGLNDSTIRQEIRKLVRLDLIVGREASNRIYYRANKANPLYPEIHNLVLKTSGLVDILRDALDDKRIETAFVFGSIASGEEKAGSDVDLMVIGELGLRALSKLLSAVGETIGREVNPHVLQKSEFRKRLKTRDHFISTVLNSARIFVKGSENDLAAMNG